MSIVKTTIKRIDTTGVFTIYLGNRGIVVHGFKLKQINRQNTGIKKPLSESGFLVVNIKKSL
jgi:hypothetical protein